MPKRISLWLIAGWLILGFADQFIPHSSVYACDPISGSILVSLAISAAVAGASAGVEYLVAKHKKASPVDRGKQDDIRVSLPGYGESIVKAWGAFRSAPIWVWHTPIVHTIITTPGQGGGKGAPKPPTGDTVDHIYTTSLAGVFHDGLLHKGVKRIWFDTDLVYHADLTNNFADLASTRTEAEWGVLAGGASVTTQAECSGGKKVTGLGSGGSVTLPITVDTAGLYVCAIHYTSTVDRTFKVSANGGVSVDVICTASGAASIVAIETLTVSLSSGANTIAFANAGAACPDLDYIDIAPDLSFVNGRDTRAFSGLIDPNKIAPTDQDQAWAFANEAPVFSDPDGGVSGGGFYSATLAKYGQPSIRIYPGSETQDQDSAIVADKGAANTPAFRGQALLVIEGLQLQGSRIPNVTIEADQGVRELTTIVGDIYDLVGVSSANRDLTALNGLLLGDSTGFSAGTYSSITWAGLSNATQTTGGAITKTSGAANTWNAYANSSSFASGDASIRFTASTGIFLIGFSTTSTPGTNPAVSCPFAVLLNTTSYPSLETKNAIQVVAGVQSSDVGVWAPGDLFQVELRDGRFAVYQNGVELTGFVNPVPSYPLYFIYMGFATGGGPSAASKATAANIGSVPSISNGGGIVLTSRRTAGDLLADLQTRFQFDLPEVDGKVKAVLRSGTSDITIPYAELRAHNDGEEVPAYDALISDIDPLLLPARVDVNYLDPGLDYHNNTQSDMRLVGPQYDNQSVSLSIVESADNMKKLATVLLYKPDREGRSFRFTTGPKYMHVHQGTVVTLTLLNATHVVRIAEAKFGLPAGVCEFDAVRQEASIYSPTAAGTVGTGTEPPIVAVSGSTKGVIIDGPLLRAEDAGDGTQPVVYVAMCGRGSGAWPGGFLYREYPIDSGNYALLTNSDKPSSIGVGATVLSLNFANISGASGSGTSITKTASTGFGNCAAGSDFHVSGATTLAEMRYTVPSFTTNVWMVGLSTTNSPTTFTTLSAAWYLGGGGSSKATPRDGGTNQTDYSVIAGDVLIIRLEMVGGNRVARYYLNGVLKFTGAARTETDLYGATAIDTNGQTVTGLSYTTGLPTVSDPSVWDRTSSLEINFYSDTTLSSATEQELLANPELNLLAVVNPTTNEVEYVQFKTAVAGTAMAPYISNYTVSTFLRGRVSTDNNVAVHTSADDVVVIDSTVKPRRLEVAEIGRSELFRFVTSGQNLADAATLTQSINGVSLKPLAPTHLRGRRSQNGDLLIQWTRRERLPLPLRDNAGTPLSEEQETYIVEVYDVSTLVRSVRNPKADLIEAAEWDVFYDPAGVIAFLS